jgi:hypothetical protein
VPPGTCKCKHLPELADVAMTGDNMAVIDPIKERRHFGGAAWWLWYGMCEVCQQTWLIAQDERVNDVFLMRRLSATEVQDIDRGTWPPDFRRYEDVLRLGRDRGHNWTYIDSHSPSLLATIDDLLGERPEITIDEIARLLNIDSAHASELVSMAKNRRTH